MDVDMRRKEREFLQGLSVLHTPDDYRRHAARLRRAGMSREADLHDLHALGMDRVQLHQQPDKGNHYEFLRKMDRLHTQWRNLADRVRQNGDNPLVTLHKAPIESDANHRETLAGAAARAHGVSVRHSTTTPFGRHRTLWHSFSAPYEEEGANERAERAANEFMGALRAHGHGSEHRVVDNSDRGVGFRMHQVRYALGEQ